MKKDNSIKIEKLNEQVDFLSKKLTKSNERITALENELAFQTAVNQLKREYLDIDKFKNPCTPDRCSLCDICLDSTKSKCISYNKYLIVKNYFDKN